jgi:hypothetical protein
MKFIVEYEGWIEVEAESEVEAFTNGFAKLNELISPICDGGKIGDWEIEKVSLDDEIDA